MIALLNRFHFFNIPLISNNIRNVRKRNSHIQFRNDKNVAYIQIHICIRWERHSQTFVSNDPRCNCFAPLPRHATNFKNVCHIKKNYSVLHSTKTDTLTALQRVFSSKYTWNHIVVFIFVGRSVSSTNTAGSCNTIFSLSVCSDRPVILVLKLPPLCCNVLH